MLHPTPTDVGVVLPVAEVVELAKWIVSMKETGDSLAGCTLIDQVE